MTGVVTAAYAVVGPASSGHDTDSASASAHHALAMIEQQRQTMIEMAEASHSLNVVSSPKIAGGPQKPVHHPAPPPSSSDSGSSGPQVPSVAPADPGSAQSIAFNMMSQFGWSPDAEFGCLDNIWSRESGWQVTAENPSGAYGIPQALPGAKMATAGPDWQTDAATQIRWGLGYIQSTYGDPCSAWAHWQINDNY